MKVQKVERQHGRRRVRAEFKLEDESDVAVLAIVAPRHSGGNNRCPLKSELVDAKHASDRPTRCWRVWLQGPDGAALDTHTSK